MRSVLEMIKYRLHILFRGHLYVMPLVALVLFDGFCFSMKPIHLVTCTVLLCFVLFLTMVWTGWMIMTKEDPVEEQLLQLRAARKSVYYIGKSLFLLTVGLIFALLALAAPLLLSALTVFSGEVTAGDMLQTFLLLLGCACCGIALGSLLPPRVMKDRKLALLLTLLLAVVTALASILKKYAAVGWLMWLLPPVSDVAGVYSGSENFRFPQTVMLFGAMAAYAVLYLVIQSVISHKKGY